MLRCFVEGDKNVSLGGQLDQLRDPKGATLSEERLFTVEGAVAVPAEKITLAEAGLKERDDLQEWVLAYPTILGDDVMVISFEFDRWLSASGKPQLDRLDVLGLDSEGRLVVAELKRDRAPDTVEMQAIKYAAMTSRFTEDDVLEQYMRFLDRDGDSPVDEETAQAALLGHAGELDAELLRRPRIVLLAGDFLPVTTASVVWLTEMGLDITLQQVQAYRVYGDRTAISVTQLYPIADIEDFTISPARADAQRVQEKRKRTRERSSVARLVQSGRLEDGALLELRPTTEIGPDVRAQIEQYLKENPDAGWATWRNDRSKPLIWQRDGEGYRPTVIVRQILREAAGVERSVRGPSWWVDKDGVDLASLAGPTKGGFDWTLLHRALEALPGDRWTTYGDLAELVDTAPQAVGQHLNSCTVCTKAAHVLGSGGRALEEFQWSDPERTETQAEALAAAGISFSNNRADPSAHASAADLEELLSDAGAEE